MRLRRVAIIAGCSLLLLVAATFWFWKTHVADPYSSPTAIRTNDAYLRAYAPATNLPPFTDDAFLSVSRGTVAAGEVTVAYATASVTNPSGNSEYPDVDYGSMTVHSADATNAVRIGDGAVRLAYIAVATEPPPAGHKSFGMRVPAKYYTASLNPIPLEEPLRRWLSDPHLIVGRLPGARFIFACSNLAGFIPMRFQAFDARTHYPISSSHYLSASSNRFTFNAALCLWHQTPVEVVGTLAVGPADTYSMKPIEGTQLRFPGGAIKLLAIAQGEFELVSSTPSTTNKTESYHVNPRRLREPFPPEFSVMFDCWPRAYNAPIEFEFYDHSGRRMQANMLDRSERISIGLVVGSPEQLKEIRLKHYPNLHRLVVTLPELPGLPESNRNLTNLFDLHIPHLNVQAPQDLPRELGKLLQMDVKYIAFGSHAYTNRSFQNQRTNTTARGLFTEISSYRQSKYDQLVVDSEKNEIRTHRSLLAGPIKFVASLFRSKN
jgi:hypothetical protein